VQRADLEHVIRAAADIAGDDDIVMFRDTFGYVSRGVRKTGRSPKRPPATGWSTPRSSSPESGRSPSRRTTKRASPGP
jgi:hypothetical protein